MKRIFLSLLSLAFFSPSLLFSETPRFQLDVEIAPANGDGIVVSMPHLALEIDDDAQLTLPVPSGTIAAEFDFNVSDQFVMVDVYDPAQMEITEKGPRGAKIASATLTFSFGQKTPIVESSLGTISFTLTPPEGWEPEKKTE